MANEIYKVNRVKTLPTTGLVNGDQYLLQKSSGRFELYVVAPNLQLIPVQGVTDGELNRLNQLQQADINKLKTDYTKAEIDDRIKQVNGELIPISGSVLPQGTSIPSWVTTAGKAELIGGEGGTTFTQTGGAPTTVSEGYIRMAYYNKATNLWTFDSDEKPLPSILINGQVSKEDTRPVSGGEVFDSISQIAEKSSNIINYKDFKGITFAVSPTTNEIIVTPSNNWLGVILTKDFETGVQYYIDNIAVTSNQEAPVIYFADNSNKLISQILKKDFTGGVVIPEGTRYIYIRIANVVDIGLDPTNNIYATTTQMKKGSSSTPFTPYGFYVNFPEVEQDVVQGDTKAVSGDAVYKKVDELFEGSYNLINYLDFKGGTYRASSSTNILDLYPADVNWISVKVPVKPLTNYYLEGYQSTLGPTVPIVQFGDYGNFKQGEILKQDFNNSFTTLEDTAYVYIRIANELNIAANPTNNIYTDTLQLTEGSESKPFQPFDLKVIKQSLLPDNDVTEYPKFLLKFNSFTTPYSGTLQNYDVVEINEHLKNGVYARHILRYQRLDYSDFVSGDFSGGKIVRYAGTQFFKYDKTTDSFQNLANDVIRSLESEFVLSSGYWSGGYHGNEDYSKVYFLVDNKVYNTTGDVDFTSSSGYIEANSFSYTMRSQLKLHSNKSVICERKKVVEFKNGGYEIKNKLIGSQSVNAMMYIGICCVGKMFTDITTDDSLKLTATGGGANLTESNIFTKKVYYSSADYGLNVEAYINEYNFDKLCLVLIWDRAGDTKYYRQIPVYSFSPGSSIEFTQTVEIFKK